MSRDETHRGMPGRLRAWLDAEGVRYRYVEHGPTRTSEESAAARGEPLEIGAKALLLKVDDSYVLVVLSAALKLRSNRFRRYLGASRLRFATTEELDDLIGVPSGAVPPFGRPIVDLPLYIDRSVMRTDKSAFNAGTLTASIIMSTDDYLRLARGTVVEVT
ncbi:MAG: YbaK/EbsC family protein [Thermoanaerobaculia bacterium]|nr:YbaK/EbsC family protein [Thermoanaerobaculia bacterium]